MKQGLLVILSVILFGCPSNYNATEEDPDYSWTEWTDGQLVSIIDDSLAVLKICKYQKKTWYDYDFREAYEIINSRTGLFIVNYREKQKPIWGDTLSYDLRITGDYYKDSSLLVFDKDNNQFGFWKIGEKSIEFKKYSDSRNCKFYIDSYNDVSLKARPWVNGNVLFVKPRYNRYDNCPISLLNTETGQIEDFDFSGEYEWLAKCEDMSYIENTIVCIRRTSENLELIVNDIVADTSSERNNVISNWYGNYIKEGNGDESKGWVYKIDLENFKFDKSFNFTQIENYNRHKYDYERVSVFQDNSFNTFVYYAKDLLNAGN